ncbi:hypothetical protein [Luteolibacter sp. LG18]|uniref:hypothetical protein n=1 Tax=Luteolibacter sp. LG18 TaxID=2819286 RepID=UPI002B2CBBC2|nr:hypothetical protein llg_43980 [Luteolibacter sp. LG18]
MDRFPESPVYRQRWFWKGLTRWLVLMGLWLSSGLASVLVDFSRPSPSGASTVAEEGVSVMIEHGCFRAGWVRWWWGNRGRAVVWAPGLRFLPGLPGREGTIVRFDPPGWRVGGSPFFVTVPLWPVPVAAALVWVVRIARFDRRRRGEAAAV